ncbi:hypothetical protein [Rubellimicrobium aerolatum]|uniref:TetR/AcrR family transcriptional regulator n=1 Tax=Rubellimicrobium aerolatum TaxID=490979 RepID=A0ABW0SE17_9RHOB|nr:hypothetical protein [Rubellimicrobium aerolatum]MBP1806836.1 hypothetical protein [Rubellimicrobium aerolatum]
MATVALEVEEVLAAGESIVAAPPEGAEPALLRLIWQYYDHSLEYLSKAMWRDAMAISIQEPHTPHGRRYAALDARLADQVARLVARLLDRGSAAPDLDAVALGQLLFNNLNAMFIEFVKDDAMTLDHLKARVAAQTKALARLLESRP